MSYRVANLTTRSMLSISAIVGFLFTLNQGVSVGPWLWNLIGRWGVLVNLARNTFLAAIVIFAALYVARQVVRSKQEAPGNDGSVGNP
jgi:hypothetical protein